MSDLSIYVHFPFCTTRCGYCDFNTNTGMGNLIPGYIGALLREIKEVSQVVEKDAVLVHTIYLGGGTPTLVPPALLGDVIKSIQEHFRVDENCEITVEANPGGLSLEMAAGLVDQGINRISIGMQSSQPRDLATLDREHNYVRVATAVRACRAAGISNLNLDLIYGIPLQTLESWEMTLGDALDLDPDHLSLYALTVEEGTPLALSVDHGTLPDPDADLAADMYELAMERLAGNGYLHYEISNWGRIDRATGQALLSRHNQQYWMNEPYLGFGTGAHGYFDRERIQNVAGLVEYLRRLESPRPASNENYLAAEMTEPISSEREMQETMMMGLRLLEIGVSRQRFRSRFGVELGEVFQAEVEKLIDLGMVEWAGAWREECLRLTSGAYLVANRVFREFVL